jgi:hypothetical protein
MISPTHQTEAFFTPRQLDSFATFLPIFSLIMTVVQVPEFRLSMPQQSSGGREAEHSYDVAPKTGLSSLIA